MKQPHNDRFYRKSHDKFGEDTPIGIEALKHIQFFQHRNQPKPYTFRTWETSIFQSSLKVYDRRQSGTVSTAAKLKCPNFSNPHRGGNFCTNPQPLGESPAARSNAICIGRKGSESGNMGNYIGRRIAASAAYFIRVRPGWAAIAVQFALTTTVRGLARVVVPP